jgi:formate dehydrogenase beta subunit
MSDRKTLQVQRISGHPGPVPGEGTQRQEKLCKLIDTTTCIGCKACEVACVEWNDMPFQPTMFDNTYQTMPDTNWNYWNLIKFNEVSSDDGSFQWLMRKHQCMHRADPGCLEACPADGAIVQYSNGIVDFEEANCIGCEFCVSGCPFNVPKFNPSTKKVYKCTLCSDRVGQGLEPACIKSCPTGCLHSARRTTCCNSRTHALHNYSSTRD